MENRKREHNDYTIPGQRVKYPRREYDLRYPPQQDYSAIFSADDPIHPRHYDFITLLKMDEPLSYASADDTWIDRPTLEIVSAGSKEVLDQDSQEFKSLSMSATVRVNDEQVFIVEIYENLPIKELRDLDLSDVDMTGVVIEDTPHEFALVLAEYFNIALESIKTSVIPFENICPEFPSSFTAAPEGIMDYCYFKYAILDSDATKPDNTIKDIVLKEAEICELLMNNPHANIAKYWGCYVVDGRIRALCYGEYTMTLEERIQTGVPLDIPRCLKGIRDGIDHMHSLGLVHNDINPANIMMDPSDTPVIIDFDSCRRVGERIAKGGTPGWCIEHSWTSDFQNDFYGFEKLEEYLSQSNVWEVDSMYVEVGGDVH